MTAREKALAAAVERYLSADGTPIEQADAMREALAMEHEPDDITLFLVEAQLPDIVDLVDVVARVLGAKRVDRTFDAEQPHGAWRFPDMVRARTAAVVITDVCATTNHPTPPVAVRYPSDRE